MFREPSFLRDLGAGMRGNIAPDTGQENAQALYLREKKKLGDFQLAIVMELQCRGENAAQKPAIIDARNALTIFLPILS